MDEEFDSSAVHVCCKHHESCLFYIKGYKDNTLYLYKYVSQLTIFEYSLNVKVQM